MVKIYSDADLWNAFRQRRRILNIFYIITAIFVAALVALIVLYTQLPYNSKNGVWVIVATSVLSAVYIAFSFPYMGISFKRCRAYCKMLRYISVGLKESALLPFKGIDDWTTHDGVDVNVAVFSVHNRKREEDMERQVFVDGEMDFPPFEEGKSIRIVTQGNLLIEYEILD